MQDCVERKQTANQSDALRQQKPLSCDVWRHHPRMFVDDDVIGRVVNEQDGVATISLHHLHNDVIDSRTRVSSWRVKTAVLTVKWRHKLYGHDMIAILWV